MFIDFHTHFGRLFRERYPSKIPLSPAQLIDIMNQKNIEKSVLLPLESPEGAWGYLLTEEVCAARDLYPDRFIAFVCVDPRYPHAAEFIEYFVQQHGCKGFGEHVNGLAFDDDLNHVIYATCNKLNIPILFEMNENLCWDEIGLPRLERCLKSYPNVTFIGHGPAFWSAISEDDPRGGYPKGPIKPYGAIDRLLTEYANLYADLSAYSGYNAMTRDPEFTIKFIERHWQKLLWGTDIMAADDPLPQIAWWHSLEISPNIKKAIAKDNAKRLLGLV